MQQHVTIGPLRDGGGIVGAIVTIEDVTAARDTERTVAARLRAGDTAAIPPDALGPDTNPATERELMAALGDEDWRVRRAAVAAIASGPDYALVRSLVTSLRERHDDLNVLSSALQLVATREVDIVGPLLALLQDEDVNLRIQAALVLGERRDPAAVESLLRALEDPDVNVRFHAIEALGKIGDERAADALTSIAETGDFFLGFPALDALLQTGGPGVAPRLVRLLDEELLQVPAAEALGRLGDEACVGPLVALLNRPGAPVEPVAGALATLYDRAEREYGEGARVSYAAAETITATGAQNLIDAIGGATADWLRAIVVVLGWVRSPAVDHALTRLLGDVSVRDEVVEALVRSGSAVVELLVDKLDASDFETRKAAIVALGRVGDRRATPALARQLARAEGLEILIASALALIGDAGGFEPLLALLGHADAAVRQAAIGALNSIGHPQMESRIAPLLRDPDPRLRESAVKIAGYFGYRSCADLLIQCCRDAQEPVRHAAVEHLAFVDDARVLDVLTSVLSTDTPRVRAGAAHALGRTGDPRAVAPLVGALSDSDAWVRYFAARALGRYAHGMPVEKIVGLASSDPAPHVRFAAIETLGRSDSPEAGAVIIALARDNDDAIAAAAIQALRPVDAGPHWPLVSAALRASSAVRRVAAARALGGATTADAVEALQWAAAADEDRGVWGSALESLGRVAASEGPLSAAAVEALVTLLAEAERRDSCIRVLSALPDRRIDTLARGLDHPRGDVRCATVVALARMKRAAASAWVQKALEGPDAAVRQEAAAALGHLGNVAARRRLAQLARTDPDASVRRAAAAAVGDVNAAFGRVDDGNGKAADHGAP
jgi:HEAT repeat protein